MRPSNVEFTILGREFRATGINVALEHWLRHHWEFADPAKCQDFRINVDSTPGPPSLPTPIGADVTVLDGLSIDWQRHGARWWSTAGIGAGVSLRIGVGNAAINIWGDDSVPHARIWTALHVALCEALRASGLVPLHAAVAARDGRATAFFGRSGAGKSTTLLSAVNVGWSPLAEDFAWLDPSNRHVYGWDRGVRLSARGVDRISHAWDASSWRPGGHDDKLLLDYDKLAMSKVVCAELTRIGLLHQHSTRDASWEPVAEHDKVRSFWESTGVPLCPVNRIAFAQRVPRLLAQLEVSRLVLGRTQLEL